MGQTVYQLDQQKVAATISLLMQECAASLRAPIVIPLGNDDSGLYNYRVISLRHDMTVSDHIVVLGRSESFAFHFGGCTCEAGLHERQCRHVALAWPVHQTFLFVERVVAL